MYDYVIVNEDIQQALAEIRAILVAERLRRQRAEAGITNFVKQLLEEQ